MIPDQHCHVRPRVAFRPVRAIPAQQLHAVIGNSPFSAVQLSRIFPTPVPPSTTQTPFHRPPPLPFPALPRAPAAFFPPQPHHPRTRPSPQTPPPPPPKPSPPPPLPLPHAG